MRFPLVPAESKQSINRAGQVLIDKASTAADLESARDLAEKWRACHAYPINTFQSTLRRKTHSWPDSIVAQRLKRMPTIIDKLKRYPTMELTTMQDIGGLRAVLPTVKDAIHLATEYKDNSRFAHELVGEKDYIQYPRDEDGYRSIHLIYKYRNTGNPHYDGLKLELQIRSKLQHIWATAVETMGTILGQALKSRQGDSEWLEFFAIVSSAFAYIEKCPPVPRFRHMSRKETSLDVARAESKLGALYQMRAFSGAVGVIAGQDKKWSYHLMVLNSLDRSVAITAYDRDQFEQAMADYSKFEKEAADGKKIEPVLVSTGPIEILRRAYPNFFLDISEFVSIVRKIVSSTKK